MQSDTLEGIFEEIAGLLQKHAKGLVLTDVLEGSKAKAKKPQLVLLGAKSVAIGNRKPQRTYVAGVIQQKHFVGFYSMPLYSHPKDIVIMDRDLAKMRKGKSCINVTALTMASKKELERVIKEGIRIYKKEGWI